MNVKILHHYAALQATGDLSGQSGSSALPVRARGFTMVEIAISLAIIAFALVAIIGVLPEGMNVQKDNREKAMINSDAGYLMDVLRSGTRAQYELTNYVLAVTNVFTLYSTNGTVLLPPATNWYNTTGAFYENQFYNADFLVNPTFLVGVLSTPKYILTNFNGSPAYYSNTTTADLRAITSPAVDQGASAASRDFAFHYRVTIEIVPGSSYAYGSSDPNSFNVAAPAYTVPITTPQEAAFHANDWVAARNLQHNLNEVRLSFRWPVLQNGQAGLGRQTYRTSVGGALTSIRLPFGPAAPLYFLNPNIYQAAN